MTVNHLRVLRDLYYIADNRLAAPITDYHGRGSLVPNLRADDLAVRTAAANQRHGR